MRIQEIGLEHVDQKVTITGWVARCRTQAKFIFATIRDGAGSDNELSVLLPRQLQSDIKLEQYVELTGQIKTIPNTAYGIKPIEMHVETVLIISPSHHDYASRCPMGANMDCQLTQRHLYLRRTEASLTTMLHAVLLKSIREYFEATHCTEICPPMFVGNQCEGGASLFAVEYPDSEKGTIPVYLTQSSQFYLEYAVPSVGDCYCLERSFRNETSKTRRHLTEFEHAEAEWRNVITLEQHLDKLRHMLQGIITRFMEHGRQYIHQLGIVAHVEKLLEMTQDIIVMTHAEAIQYCRQHNIYKDEESCTHFEDRDDIREMQERAMIDKIGKIVFLTKFPKEFKSFYFATDETDGTVLGCDVEVPGVGEIIGSGIREWNAIVLKRKILEAGLCLDDYSEYIDIRIYGHGRTSGMGLGVGRMLTWLLDRHSIREVIDYPRVPGRVRP